eukprot:CAMPEP_0116902986 /NCGR_PEP_ID=MMETSP0467-20121206/10436_1 /TAXON_ID=283647 /ORGANISM="Mesodinium pulex, Strain SPMC105" /LENGTH=161 /DNA_ID=CAMNT_0004577117 /DNA_START=57 /DNA_END=542 /DNA_ORIENTATION=-
MASVGTQIPGAIKLQEGNPGGVVTTDEIFAGKKVVLIGVPGAFTPGCHKTHAPGYIANADKYREKGVDEIVCITVNDAFVAGAWAESLGAEGKMRILADANAELTKALGMELDLTGPFGLGGLRTKRFSAYVVNSEIKVFNLEPDFTGLTCSLSDGLLSQI